MHMIGTNLSVWLNVLIQETKHEIVTFYNPENNTIEMNKQNTHLHVGRFAKKKLFYCLLYPLFESGFFFSAFSDVIQTK